MAVLCAVNENTDIGNIVKDSYFGLSGLYGDDEVFQNNVKLLCENPKMRQSFGENGWKLLLKEFNVEYAYNKIMFHFLNISP